MNTRHSRSRGTLLARSCLFACLLAPLPSARAAEAAAAPSTVHADVVALDQPFMYNRLGAAQPQGMIFALERDVVPIPGAGKPGLNPGEVMLRPEKRARPLVLRVNAGQYLEIHFRNLLAPRAANPPNEPKKGVTSLQPATRSAGVHIAGLELVSYTDGHGVVHPGIESDATWVGRNPDSLLEPSATETRIYKYYAKAEGTFMLYSAGADWNGQLGAGLFGAVNVEPAHAEWYRSQITHDDLVLAARRAPAVVAAAEATSAAAPVLTAEMDSEGHQAALTTALGRESLWTFVTVEADRQTVHRAEVLVRGDRMFAPDGRPIVDYDAVYPAGHPRAGQPILRMTQPRADGGVDLVDSDLTAIITGPGADTFPFTENGPDFYANPVYPGRRQPFREFTIMYHESFGTVQAFPQFYTPQLNNVLGAGTDNFAINYGSAGIGAEVLANRLGVGPMGRKDAVDLKFEEFFLSSWANGDPAMVVDVPANAPNQTVANPAHDSQQLDTAEVSAIAASTTGTVTTDVFKPLEPKLHATKAFYPDDPSNVFHSYMRDHVTMRLLHTGGGITHVHHLHAHQWLRSPNSDNSHYLDSQMIAPGSTYSLEIAYNGSGNRNETVGDSIFHCHFYPHFAGGMWALWRVHDVFESGTQLDREGRPVPGWNRALPDGEIERGTPIPAIVPLPTLAMAPAPAPVRLIDDGRRVEVAHKAGDGSHASDYDNPGYPFFVPGVSGHRAPHPPLDFAWEEKSPGDPKLGPDGRRIYLDGGLPRHLVLDGLTVHELHTRWDFSKDFLVRDKDGKPIAGGLVAFELPEEGTAIEQAAMTAHATRTHASIEPNGDPGNFILNGLPPVPGAPFANPSVDDNGNAQINTRRYQGAAIQRDVVLNKQGWHFPQQRFLSLWEDVKDYMSGARAPQPLFFRAVTGESIEFWHTNLVPDYYDLDDFQVRTPTDIIGQHIHLVKFDVLASDGAGNGFNYEDGTFSPDEVRNRVDAINRSGGLFAFDPRTQFKGQKQYPLTVKPAPTVFGPAPVGQNWAGAQTTIQRWDTDPVENNQGEDRTLRTVFTHDHFGPSTHQQVGLYGGLLVEPEGSKWYDPITGGLLYDTKKRHDGGPTSWQANIVTANPAESYREFALEFGDFQLAYTAGSPSKPGHPTSPLFTSPLTNLAAGPVSASVRQTFTANGVVLSDAATVSSTSPTQWLLTDPTAPGLSYTYAIVQSAPPTASAPATYQVTPQQLPESWSAPSFAINPPPADAANKNSGTPYPTLISTFGGYAPGTQSLNYRSEPIPSRVADATGQPASGDAGDLALAYASTVPRANGALNIQPVPGTPIAAGSGFTFPANIAPTLNGTATAQPASGQVQPGDPFTPLLRAYAGDRIQVRTLVGAHHNPHFLSFEGVKWFYEPGYANSGYKNNQPMGISEHFEMNFDLPRTTAATRYGFADYLYNASAGNDGISNGLWGIMRSFQQPVKDLLPLPNNRPSAQPVVADLAPPPGAKVRSFRVHAVAAQRALAGAKSYPGQLVYNTRGQSISGTASFQADTPINNPDALIYVLESDLDLATGQLKDPAHVEPLILRAAAGEWIQITLFNDLKETDHALTEQFPAGNPWGNGLPNIKMKASGKVGLNPQVVGYDITKAGGLNVGFNATSTVAPGGAPATFFWYAGNIGYVDGKLVTTPVEFGGINLNPADPLEQHKLGLVGALVIEPEGSSWVEDEHLRAAATVTKADRTIFRDFVMICQDDVTLQIGKQAISKFYTAPLFNGNFFTVNYGAEPFMYRYNKDENLGASHRSGMAAANALVHGQDPQTPIYTAIAGTPVRFRMLHPASSDADGETLAIDGHVFQEEPFTDDGRVIGDNPLSQWFGTRGGHGARDRFEVVLSSAGGEHHVPGDYLYRSLVTLLGGGDYASGTWGIFRVLPPVAAKPLTAPAVAPEAAPQPDLTPEPVAPTRSPIEKRYEHRHPQMPEETSSAQ